MSVIIKDMEMPSCCYECRFMHAGIWNEKAYPCICYAYPGGFVIKPSETDLIDGLCPLERGTDDV